MYQQKTRFLRLFEFFFDECLFFFIKLGNSVPRFINYSVDRILNFYTNNFFCQNIVDTINVLI